MAELSSEDFEKMCLDYFTDLDKESSLQAANLRRQKGLAGFRWIEQKNDMFSSFSGKPELQKETKATAASSGCQRHPGARGDSARDPGAGTGWICSEATHACRIFGCGCQNRFGIPFWLVGEFTTHFRTHFSGDWDVHWGYDLDFDPWPFVVSRSRTFCVARRAYVMSGRILDGSFASMSLLWVLAKGLVPALSLTEPGVVEPAQSRRSLALTNVRMHLLPVRSPRVPFRYQVQPGLPLLPPRK